MIERLFAARLAGLPTRLLAWTLGRVSDSDIELEILKLSGNSAATDGVDKPHDNLDCRIIWNKGFKPWWDNPQGP